MSTYTSAVAEQITDLRAAFPDKKVIADPDGAGGAYVTVKPIDPGPTFIQSESTLGFQITNLCPHADIYPVFLSPDLKRVDGRDHISPFTVVSWRNQPALQFSTRTNPHDPQKDTAATKVAQVIEWLAIRE
ncbi:hypothetical protein [Catenulispora rubra]|uniref:hypothetical protein n=1 Tax=Catenulispora rubra TaxID=280293 RepID=UPI00189247DD|nr:hypothetical protein [Catenulispora rubra]